MNQAQN